MTETERELVLQLIIDETLEGHDSDDDRLQRLETQFMRLWLDCKLNGTREVGITLNIDDVVEIRRLVSLWRG